MSIQEQDQWMHLNLMRICFRMEKFYIMKGYEIDGDFKTFDIDEEMEISKELYYAIYWGGERNT